MLFEKWIASFTLCLVMAGLVPAIHDLMRGDADVDARHKAGYDR